MTLNRNLILMLGIASVSGFHSLAHADVRVFRLNEQPTTLESPTRSDTPLRGLTRFLRGTSSEPTSEAVYDFIAGHPLAFGIDHPDPDTLPLKKVQKTNRGSSFRFSQSINGVPVAGAELVAVFNATGELESVNSSLKPTFTAPQNAEITREEALQIAAKELHFENVELGQDENDGLKIIDSEGRTILVWQLSLREGADGSRAQRVQVIAAGPGKGTILKSAKIGHDISGDITIYDATLTILLPNPIYKGVQVLKNGKRRGVGFIRNVDEAKNAHKSLLRTSDYFLKTFQRDSFDGNGASLIAAVNVGKRFSMILDPLGHEQNAAWMGPWKMFSFGAGGAYIGNFTKALDVVAHEYTHAVIDTTSKLVYEKQSGALNEHLADVFGVVIEQAYEPSEKPFLIGEKCLRGKFRDPRGGSGGLRDMLEPHKSLNARLVLNRPHPDPFGQPAHMSEIAAEFGPSCVPKTEIPFSKEKGNDNCGVHTLSGIPNRAIALAIQAVGWEPIAQLAYEVMTERLLPVSDFANYRDQMLEQCRTTLPRGTCKEIEQSFAAVGL